MPRAFSWLAAALVFAIVAESGFALEPRWHFDTDSTARSLPVVVDANGDGNLEVVLTTRFDGSLWILNSAGALLQRLQRTQWLEGWVAAASRPGTTYPLLSFQDSTGRVDVLDYGNRTNWWWNVPGEPRLGTMPVLADLTGDGVPELLTARRDGILTVLDLQLRPMWQFGSYSSFDTPPTVAPVFHDGPAVYAAATDGTLHCLDAAGTPLWHFRMDNPGVRFPGVADPLAVQFDGHPPSVLISDSEGWLYSVHAAQGTLLWRLHVGGGALGSPAIADVLPGEGREIVVVSAQGRLAIIAADGELLHQTKLPAGGYVPRPLVADVTGDGTREILVAAQDWHIAIVSAAGEPVAQLELQGQAHEGLVLADVTQDGLLELLAATGAGRVHCFETLARPGDAGSWLHPRADWNLAGYVAPIAPEPRPAAESRTRRAPRPVAVAYSDFVPDAPYAFVLAEFSRQPNAHTIRFVLHQHGEVVGAAVAPAAQTSFSIPFVYRRTGNFTLDYAFLDESGGVRMERTGVPVFRPMFQLVEFDNADAYIEAVEARGKAYRTPESWNLPKVQGKDSWHVLWHMPERWAEFGLAHEPFIADAIPRIPASMRQPESVFRPGNPAWEPVMNSGKPFFLINGYFQPDGRYPEDAMQAILDAAGDRFLGFQVHEWGYHLWKEQFEAGALTPADRVEATEHVHQDFERLLDLCHGRIYPGQGYCLWHHHAFAWGAPLGYVETGENIPCAPLQFAFIRGAARQYGGKPWGAYLSNWFRGTVADTRYRGDDTPPILWRKPDLATGPDCGHSPSLEYRLHMAAHLAGATFVHHESDGFQGSIFASETAPGEYELSPFGEAIQRWHEYAQEYPERGVPYTPIAFLVDWNHNWRPREDILGIWPRDRAALSMEAVFEHVFPYGRRLDFERGYLPHGPYGDIFDVITGDAGLDTLTSYGVIWPLGSVQMTSELRRNLTQYVEQGGILVLDGTLAAEFSRRFTGVRLDRRNHFGIGVQTPLMSVPAPPAPFTYQPLTADSNAESIAWTESGDALVTWRRNGEGIVIVSGAGHWTDHSDSLLPLVPALMQSLAHAFLPLRPPEGLQMLLNQTSSGWIIGLINNDGITKTPTKPASIDPGHRQEAILRFRQGIPLRFDARLGEFSWSNYAGGLTTELGAGAVAVVEVDLIAR